MSDETRITRSNRIDIPSRALDAEVARETQPIRRVPGPAGAGGFVRSSGRRRPIDAWIERGAPPPVTVEVHFPPPRFEVDPCPSWMRDETYRDLLVELRDAVEREAAAGRAFVPTKRQRWALRHVLVVQDFPQLETDAGAYDLIGPIFALLREARKQGVLDQAGRPTKRRLGR